MSTKKMSTLIYLDYSDGYTALHLAIGMNHKEIAKFLIEIGATVNEKDR